MLTQFNRFADFLCLHCWSFGPAAFAESAGEVSIHHAADVALEVSQDDTLRMPLHLYSYRIICSLLHGSVGTENGDSAGLLIIKNAQMKQVMALNKFTEIQQLNELIVGDSASRRSFLELLNQK